MNMEIIPDDMIIVSQSLDRQFIIWEITSEYSDFIRLKSSFFTEEP
jgi:hypothetical protein